MAEQVKLLQILVGALIGRSQVKHAALSVPTPQGKQAEGMFWETGANRTSAEIEQPKNTEGVVQISDCGPCGC